MKKTASHKQSGFTLIEVLIALFIFSLISVGATSALTSSLRGQNQMQQRLEGISEIENMRALIRGDMASLILQPRREAYGNSEPYVLRADGQVLLDFTRTGRSNPMDDARGDLQRVIYVVEDGHFIRRSFSQFSPAPQSGQIDRVLLSSISRSELDFVYVPSEFSLEVALPDIRLEAGQPADKLKAIKLDLEFETGGTLTQYFEVGL